jgi:hypothetical protein
MTVQDLIELLEGFDPEAQVRMAVQPTHPLQYTIGDVVEAENSIVYLAEGDSDHNEPYLPRAARDELGW